MGCWTNNYNIILRVIIERRPGAQMYVCMSRLATIIAGGVLNDGILLAAVGKLLKRHGTLVEGLPTTYGKQVVEALLNENSR